MDPNTINLIISLISGVVGGNIAGNAMTEKTLGTIGNSISGFLGGGLGGFILKALGVFAGVTVAGQGGDVSAAPAAFDLSSLLASIGGGGASGAILTGIIGYLKSSIDKK